MLTLEHWFPTPVWYEHTNLTLEPIKSKCLDLRDQGFENRTKSNRGGWQSRDISLKEFSEFFEIENLVQERIKEIAPLINPNLALRLDNAWVNINKKGDYNISHFHPNAVISGVFYVTANEGSGRLKFYPYHLMEHYPVDISGSTIFYDHVTYTPKSGLLVFFPAWLRHEVEPCDNNEERISIAFNVSQTK